MKSLADKFYERVSRILKVSLDPLDPNGEAVIRNFKPAPRYAGYSFCRWAFTQIGLFIPFALFLLPRELHEVLDQIGLSWIRHFDYNAHWQENIPAFLQTPVKVLSVGGYLVQFVFTFVAAFLSAKSPCYLLTDYSLRIRRGLWVHRETTLSLKNIQQVKFSQNILERLWGIGSLEVRTAGGGAVGKNDNKDKDKSHVGALVGLLNPIATRELLNQSIKRASPGKMLRHSTTAKARLLPPRQAPEWTQAVHELLLASQSLKESIESRK